MREKYCPLVLLFITIALSGCLNPFAPPLGDTSQSLWTDQQTVGGLLDNFSQSYNRQDSLRYSACLDDDFIFQYYDVDNERYDQWGRDTDLKATGGLFRSFNEIHLTWYALPTFITDFAQPDSSLEFDVSFNLSMYSNSGSSYDLYGFAHFSVHKIGGGQFRIKSWSDNTVF